MTWQTFRDRLMFFGGMAGLIHQFVVAPDPNEVLVLASLALMGLPIPLRADEKASGK